MRSQDNVDAELIDRLRNRDPKGLADAYDRYGPVAFSLFLRITRDRSAAEDLVQELFIRLWNRGRDFDASRGTLGVWILSIARNMAIDHVRSAQARFATRLRPMDHVNELAMTGGRNEPESVLDRARTVSAAFTNLSSNEKRVLELAYFEGFSQTEIADRLSEPLGTVKSWTRSGLGRMRKVLREGGAK